MAGRYWIAALALLFAVPVFADTKSCLENCRKSYEACLKSPDNSITKCLNQLNACNGNCAALPDS